MALLSNMSIERTIGQMSSSSGAGGYRYIGGDGITVDNDLYKISVDYNPETLAIDDQSRLTFNPSFLQAGDNVYIGYSNGQLVISAEMFQSQFADGDKAKYDLACLNLTQAMLDIISINGQITTINGNINAISGENGSIAGLDGRIDVLEEHDTDYSSRIGTLETHDSDHASRLQTAESAISAHATTISANDIRSRSNANAIETINQTIETLTGYSGDIGNLAERMTTAEGKIDTNEDNIGINAAAIQTNADAISEITSAIDTPDTGYAARITSVENFSATNRELISGINTRLNALDPQGSAPGESLADRMTAVESTVDALEGTIQSISSTTEEVRDSLSVCSASITSLEGDLSDYETATDERLDLLESFQTEATDNISTLQQEDISLSGRIDTLEAFKTTADSRLSDLEDFKTTADSDIDTLQSDFNALSSTVGSHSSTIGSHASLISQLQTSVGSKEDKLSSLYFLEAPEPVYVAVQNSESYDPDYSYFFADPATYIQYNIDPTYVDPEDDSYDGSISYYTYDSDNDQWSSYTYVDDETFVQDASSASGLMYFEYPAGIQLYESDGAGSYTVFNGPVNPMDTYYVQNIPTFSDRYIPEISRVSSGESYDSDTTYFTIGLRGNINPYTYVDSGTFDTDISAGLFYVANWTAALAEGLYKRTYDTTTLTFHIPSDFSGIATVGTGIGNRLDVSIAGRLLSVTAAEDAESSISFAFCAGDIIECTITPVNHGTGVRGPVYAAYFGSGQISNPDITPEPEPGEP